MNSQVNVYSICSFLLIIFFTFDLMIVHVLFCKQAYFSLATTHSTFLGISFSFMCLLKYSLFSSSVHAVFSHLFIFTTLKHLCTRTNPTSLLSVKPTFMTTPKTLIFNCLATCQSIARTLGICTVSVCMPRAIFQLLANLLEEDNESYMCFRLALLHSTTYIFFLYRSPSSSSCSVVEAVSSNIDKALILHPSANIMVCGDFNAHNTEWLGHSHTTDAAGVFCQEFALAQDLTQIVDFPTRIPDCVDHQPYLLDLFLCSNPDSCTVTSHPPLGRSDHIVVSVDVKFVVKSTNEHPYHRTVYSYSKADWDGLRDHLRDVPWSDIFSHDTTFAAKELSEWVKIGIDCYIPHRKFQLKPHSSPWFTPSCAAAIAHRNHYFHRYHRDVTPDNKKLFYDARNHCKRVITEAKSSYAEATRHSIASQRIGSRDFWRICNSVLNRGKSTIPLLFNGPEVLTTSTDKANLFARNFSYNSTLDDSYQLLPDFPSRTEHRLTSRKITARMVSHAIYHLDTCKVTGPDRIPSIVVKMCSPELSPVLAKLYNKCLAKSCFPSCWTSTVEMFYQAIIDKGLKNLTNNRKKTYRTIFTWIRSISIILKSRHQSLNVLLNKSE